MPVSASTQLQRPLIARRAYLPTGVVTVHPSVILGLVGLTSLLFIRLTGSIGALGFLLATVCLLALSPRVTAQSLLAERLFLLMVGWCVLSFLWSDYPGTTLRHATQLCITVAFAIVLAYRITPLAFVKIAALAYSAAGVASLISGPGREEGGFLGIFGSKNAQAGAASMLMIAGLSLLADRSLPLRWRATGAVALAIGGVLVIWAQSVGAMVTVTVVAGLFFLILSLRRLPAMTRLVAVTLGLLGLALLALLLYANADKLALMMLDATGKDVTLTGRTELWAAAFAEIAQRPLLGAGFHAVWVHGNPLAEQFWAEFGIKSRSGFNFHNTLINNAVEIGLIGAALQAVLLFGALPPLLTWSLRSGRAGPMFLVLILGRQVVTMGVEVTFFHQFDVATVLTVVAIAYAHRYRREMMSATRAPPQRGLRDRVRAAMR